MERALNYLRAGDFTKAERRQFRGLVMAVPQIGGPDSFRDWMRQYVRPLYPHAAGVVGMGELLFGRIDIKLILGVDCPEEYLRELHTGAGLGQCPTFLRWSQVRRPLLLEPAAGSPYCLAADELRRVVRHGLKNIAAHGFLDTERRRGSYFNLFGMPGQFSSRDGVFLELLASALHQAAERMLTLQSRASA